MSDHKNFFGGPLKPSGHNTFYCERALMLTSLKPALMGAKQVFLLCQENNPLTIT